MKRLIDFVFCTLLLILLFPIVLLVAFLVLIVLGRPIFFRQTRPGLNSVPFELVKFRTMGDVGGADEVRLGKFGNFLRKSSLDELPELLNIVRGEMSFVGPRPLLMEYLPLYTDEQSRRHNVRPGLAGWAQVNGRNTLGWEEKFALDVWYVDNRSILLDLKIVLMTIPKVLGSKDIAQDGHVTMAPFQGNKE
jgi:lipopolysaccharide/colanic/teichoic acid biosynthesis glycosyltransferase